MGGRVLPMKTVRPMLKQQSCVNQRLGGCSSGEGLRPTSGKPASDTVTCATIVMPTSIGCPTIATAVAHIATQAACVDALLFPWQSISWTGADGTIKVASIFIIASVAAYTCATLLMANSRAVTRHSRRRRVWSAMTQAIVCSCPVRKHKAVISTRSGGLASASNA